MQSTTPKLTIPLSSLAADAHASAITLHAPQPADLKTIIQTLFDVLGWFRNDDRVKVSRWRHLQGTEIKTLLC